MASQHQLDALMLSERRKSMSDNSENSNQSKLSQKMRDDFLKIKVQRSISKQLFAFASTPTHKRSQSNIQNQVI
jgi:hypothetical protein